PWAMDVRLTATSPDRIVMQIKGPGTQWQPIEFAPGPTGPVEVFVSNAPKNPNGKSHFLMYQILSDPSVTLNDVEEKLGCHHPIDTVAGCSNSTFP
ncbi:MAG TPA: hypothetical protein VF713_19770, partial [Thermoanaerobaculia bacterium]